MAAHRKNQAVLYQTAILTEDVTGAVAEMESRLGGVWPVPPTVDPVLVRRVISRFDALLPDMRELRRQYDVALRQAA